MSDQNIDSSSCVDGTNQSNYVKDSTLEEIQNRVVGIKEKMEARSAIVKQWCDEQKDNAIMTEEEATKRLEDVRKRLEVLSARRSELESQGYASEIKFELDKTKMDDLRERLNEMRERDADSQNAMTDANQAKEHACEKMAHFQRSKDKEEKKRKQQITELTQGARLFKKLGLVFYCLEQSRLGMTFTQIDVAEPEKEFFVILYIQDNNEFSVEHVEPMLTGINDLVNKINADNDFSAFVQDIRKKFVSIAETAEVKEGIIAA